MKKLFLMLIALIMGVSGAWATDWTPSISGLISVGDKVSSITTASSASDNEHWYLVTQLRGGESAIYDNGTTIMRGTTSATAVSFNNKLAIKNASYLVRFIATESEGIYNIQFGSGRFATSYASTPGNVAVSTSTTPGAYAFYNCNNGSGSYFGWNLGNDTGKSVNNNGAGQTVAFWNDGKRSGTSTSDNAIWYVYQVSLNSTVATVDCSSSVVNRHNGGTNPAVFYNSSGNASTGSDWFPKYITNTKIPVTIDCGDNARLSSWSGYINAYGTVSVEISVPTAYRIKSYSFGAQISNANGTAATATPSGGEAVNIDNSSVAEISASNVNLSKTSITFTGTTSSGTECLVAFTDFNVVIEEINSLSQSYGEEATVFVNGFTGKFSRTDGTTSSTWMNKWEAADSYLPLTLDITASNMSYSYVTQNIDDISFNMACGSAEGGAKFTMTAPEGYLIKDYKLSVLSAATSQTIKPSTLTGTSISSGISSPVTVQVNRVYDKTASFSITGANGNLKTTNFIVTLVKDGYTPDGNIYQIICQRAGLAVASGGSTLSSTCADELNLVPLGSDTKQQFAFVQNDGKIYLYSVGEQKFVRKNKALNAYIGDPITIFPTGDSDYPYAFKFGDDKVINHNSSNVLIGAYGGTTDGYLDGGNRFKMNSQGTYASMSAAEAKLNAVVRNLSDLDDNTAYTISTDGRGNWYVPSSAKAITSTESDGEVDASSADPKQQFAFVKDVEGFSDNYYLYSVSEKKFVTVGELAGATGTNTFNRALLGAPDLSQNVTFVASTNSNVFPTVVTVNGRNLGISTSYTPMVIDYQSTADDGNNALIVPAIDDFDPAEAQLMLLQVHSLDLLRTVGNVGYPKSTASATTNLAGQAMNPSDYATLLSAYNAYLAESDISKPTEGKTYTIANYAKNGTLRYLYNNNGTIALSTSSSITDDYKFICHINEAGKFVFAMPNGNYLIWRGNSDGVNGNKGQTSLDEITSSENYPLTIQKFPATGDANNSTAFGKVQIIGWRAGSTNAQSSLIVKTSVENTFDRANTSNFFNDTYSSAWIITEVDDYYNKVTLTSDGKDAYASVYLPFAATIPEGVKAFGVGSQDGKNAVMTEIVGNDAGTLPATTAAILKKYDQTTNTTIYLSPAEEAASFGGTNMLRGTLTTTARESLGSGTTYVLGKIGDVVALYQYTAENLAKGKAYLYDDSSTLVKSLKFYFGDDIETSIQHADVEQFDDAPVYDLSGRRVKNTRRGLYIKGGKKFAIK